ncbi:hypothetical protein [Dyadobacter sp. LHD-138]|uniref:hypothetical protein n=1 Tax=Dyadobacter sp. LHD-138 TaxID=3071413 RepID=UPI0027E1F7DA|nr:hypothetical protein [Dyadobacter sp. LHD-138]MDQ6477287.1 hypothetical protein [Dyadobacter sp. LHD-138]
MNKSGMCSIRTLLLAALLFSATATLIKAQSPVSTTPPKGFWVVETSAKIPMGSIIRFYTEDARLIYEERMEKVCLDIRRPKTIVLLNAALDEVMINWNITHLEQNNGNIVADLKRRGVDKQLYAGRGN